MTEVSFFREVKIDYSELWVKISDVEFIRPSFVLHPGSLSFIHLISYQQSIQKNNIISFEIYGNFVRLFITKYLFN